MSGEKEEFLKDKLWTLYPHLFAERASGGKWKPYRHLRYISAKITPALIRGGGRFIVTVPPRFGKSELISNWVPTWLLHNCPQKRIILASYAAEFAAKWGAKVKENLTNNRLIATSLSRDTKAKKNFATLEGGQMMCVGVGGQITGQGADCIIIDDYLKNYKEAQSELIRNGHKDWYQSVIRTRLEPRASIVILATRWHQDDLIGWLLSRTQEKEDNDQIPWTVINMPAICDSEVDPLSRQIGEALCPERFDLKALNEIRSDVGEMVWSALFQQSPATAEGNIVKKDWLKFYDILPDSFDEEVIFADLTYKDGVMNDFTCVAMYARKGANIYLVDQIRARMDFPAQLNAIRTMAKRYPNAFEKQIEDAANSAAVISTLKSEIMGLIAVKPQTSKEARLAAVSPIIQSGNFYLPSPKLCPWVDININELLSMPVCANDDTVDCASAALARLGGMTNSIKRLTALSRW